MTSYGYCQSLKINDVLLSVMSVLRSVAWGIFCETVGGGVHRDTETLTLSAAHTHTAYTMGVRPPGFEVFCIGESRSTGTT